MVVEDGSHTLAKTPIPKSQHYVPRMLMRPFAVRGAGKAEQVQVFDKHSDRSFTARLEDVLAGRYFNTIWHEDFVQDVEGPLAKLEGRAAPVLRKLVEERSWANLDGEEQVTLAFFLAVQFVRGPDTRVRLDQMIDQMQAVAKAMAADKANGELPAEPTADERKQMVFDLMRTSAADLAELLLKKTWLLFEPEVGEFYLGDSPLAMHNDRDMGPYGNIGLAVPGIQIYCPIAPDLLLALWCPSLTAELLDAEQKHRTMLGTLSLLETLGTAPLAKVEREALAHLRKKWPFTKAMIAALKSRTPLKSDAANLRFLNHLQVRNAERYVLARNQPFDLVKEMIAHKDSYRGGMRLSF